MKKSLIQMAVAVALLPVAAGAFGAGEQRSDQAMAINLVKKAIAAMKADGNEKAFAAFNDPESIYNSKSDVNPYGDLYMLVYQLDGIQPVHGKNPKIVGKNVFEMRDADGTYLIKEMIKTCTSPEGKGWVSYKWPHSITKHIEAKQTYIERAGNFCVGTGIYK